MPEPNKMPQLWPLFLQARDRRSFDPTKTDAFRLANGAGDGLPGMIVDNFAGRLLLQTDKPEGLELASGLWSAVAGQAESLYWKALVQEANASPQYVGGRKIDGPFMIKENSIKFEIDFQAGYSQGLFLDQRDNRSAIRAGSEGKTLLNTFSYTCGFGVAAAVGGAHTINLDLSRNYLEWGKRNYVLNGLDLSGHDFIYGDVFDWLNRFRKRVRKFDLIVLDPPTFSRDRKGKVFRIEEDYGQLLELSQACLNDHGTLLCCSNTHRLTVEDFATIIRRTLGSAAKTRRGSLPSDFPGRHSLKSIWVEL